MFAHICCALNMQDWFLGTLLITIDLLRYKCIPPIFYSYVKVKSVSVIRIKARKNFSQIWRHKMCHIVCRCLSNVCTPLWDLSDVDLCICLKRIMCRSVLKLTSCSNTTISPNVYHNFPK